MKISIAGSGYVGLVTAAGLSEMGNHVLCTDVNEERVESLRRGKVPFFEPGLGEIVARNVRGQAPVVLHPHRGRLTRTATSTSSPSAPRAGDGGRADLAVRLRRRRNHRQDGQQAGRSSPSRARCPSAPATRSRQRVAIASAVSAFSVASNPEFLKEGAALDDFFRPDRVRHRRRATTRTEDAMRDLYRPLQLSSERVLVMDRRSAELSKYAANAMLAVRISFMNELSQLCDSLGADINSLRRAIGTDRRIGPHFLYAGPGYGGSCFPKDVSALSALGPRPRQAARASSKRRPSANARQQDYVFDRVMSLFPERRRRKGRSPSGVSPSSPKPTTFANRRPASWCKRLLELGRHRARARSGGSRQLRAAPTRRKRAYFDNEYDALDGADALVLMTEWRHFRNPDLDELKRRMRTLRRSSTRATSGRCSI